MNAPILRTRGLSLWYKDKIALDRLDLELSAGGVHAFVGANGAGKSSLFRVLLGFESPSAGSAEILGCASAQLTPELRGRIGFVNEEHTLPAWMRVDELARMQRRLYPQWDDARYAGVLRHFHVLPTQRISQLSRGERAGVNLAMALAQAPALLILDEPTLGLDVVAKRAFLDTVLDAVAEDAATVIYCSHQMDEIERLADGLVILERGRVACHSTPAEFCERAALWVAEFPFRPPALHDLAGVLQVQHIDGLTHIVAFGQDERFGAHLKLLGARSVQTMPVGLERAVNAFLSHGHAGALHAAPVAAPCAA
jgi:ABC-2 type transport system ATP-binding protein